MSKDFGKLRSIEPWAASISAAGSPDSLSNFDSATSHAPRFQ
jgi:hypothetical protein